jgi:hypothetical protein
MTSQLNVDQISPTSPSGVVNFTGASIPTYNGVPFGTGGGGGGGYVDPRPVQNTPSAPTSLSTTGTFKSILLKWTIIDYQNHSHVNVYRNTANSLSGATLISGSAGVTYTNFYSDSAITIGTTYYYWVSAVNFEGVEGAKNAGETGGTTGQAQTIGHSDLASAIVDATNLADNSVTASKLASAAITSFAQFAGSIQPVSVVSSTPSPSGYTGPKVILNTTDGKTYRYVSGAWTTATAAVDVVGTLTAGQIAAGAIGTSQLASGAITTDKLLVTGKGTALNDDPSLSDSTAWVFSACSFVNITDGISGSNAVRITGVGDIENAAVRNFAVAAGKQYRVSVYARKTSGTGTFFLRLLLTNYSGSLISYTLTTLYPVGGPTLENVTLTSGWVRYAGTIVAPATVVKGQVQVIANFGGSGVTDIQDFRCDEYVGADLIVDGAISATKLSANAIVAGSGIIANGAITNLLVANGAIDNLKITSGLDATKITFGTLNGGLIAAGSITAGQIQSGTITAGQIQIGTITGTQIAGTTISAGNLVNGTITNVQIAPTTIIGTNIAPTTINAGHIVNSTITGTQIAPTTIAAGNIVTGTITGLQIAPTTIAGGNIVNGTITATQILNNTITANKIVNNSLTATQIAGGTITTNEISANTITTNNIQVGAVTSAANSSITGFQVFYSGSSSTITGNTSLFSFTSTGAYLTFMCSIGGGVSLITTATQPGGVSDIIPESVSFSYSVTYGSTYGGSVNLGSHSPVTTFQTKTFQFGGSTYGAQHSCTPVIRALLSAGATNIYLTVSAVVYNKAAQQIYVSSSSSYNSLFDSIIQENKV